MMDAFAKLLTDPTNYAEEKFPRVGFESDSIHALIVQVRNTLNAARKYHDHELNAELADALELLSGVATESKTVCGREGVAMPGPAD